MAARHDRLRRNGDIYIGEGHADESPNDTDSDDATNNVGAARVLQLDKTARFIRQWYGNSVGQGKFDSVHGLAVDPRTAMSGSGIASNIASSSIPATVNFS